MLVTCMCIRLCERECVYMLVLHQFVWVADLHRADAEFLQAVDVFCERPLQSQHADRHARVRRRHVVGIWNEKRGGGRGSGRYVGEPRDVVCHKHQSQSVTQSHSHSVRQNKPPAPPVTTRQWRFGDYETILRPKHTPPLTLVGCFVVIWP